MGIIKIRLGSSHEKYFLDCFPDIIGGLILHRFRSPHHGLTCAGRRPLPKKKGIIESIFNYFYFLFVSPSNLVGLIILNPIFSHLWNYEAKIKQILLSSDCRWTFSKGHLIGFLSQILYKYLCTNHFSLKKHTLLHHVISFKLIKRLRHPIIYKSVQGCVDMHFFFKVETTFTETPDTLYINTLTSIKPTQNEMI